MTLPALVTTERLRLPLWSADDVAAIRSGSRREGWHPDHPRPEAREAAALWHEGDPWGWRHVVRGTTALGSIGFFAPPAGASDGVPEVEVGFGLVAEARGWGFATEALRGLVLLTDAAGVRVRASVEPADRASLRVLTTAGFTSLRGPDEDGHLVVAHPLPAASAASAAESP